MKDSITNLKDFLLRTMEEDIELLEMCGTIDEIYCVIYSQSQFGNFILSKIKYGVSNRAEVIAFCKNVTKASRGLD